MEQRTLNRGEFIVLPQDMLDAIFSYLTEIEKFTINTEHDLCAIFNPDEVCTINYRELCRTLPGDKLDCYISALIFLYAAKGQLYRIHDTIDINTTLCENLDYLNLLYICDTFCSKQKIASELYYNHSYMLHTVKTVINKARHRFESPCSATEINIVINQFYEIYRRIKVAPYSNESVELLSHTTPLYDKSIFILTNNPTVYSEQLYNMIKLHLLLVNISPYDLHTQLSSIQYGILIQDKPSDATAIIARNRINTMIKQSIDGLLTGHFKYCVYYFKHFVRRIIKYFSY